ncbi:MULTISPECIES: chemotaxis protein CheB [Rhizobium/Agrobacterium group]|uniref:protein-glutamate methylesterase n=2 Tax=Rhizobium/Agrobacterium group TaxID=227290 RepID=B9K3H1_ALLAM|nr:MULTISPECIES: chemotaxis protein CheB [Rhizobium/Agrobacterium group]ACM39419.1 protein-glutamate methylesterase [Allorhizobium ampelinum S4]MCF1437017.1 chemotaxis protein CheB [Allorhizobium ampelinum]MCF1449058.1 chemotaxis protein CheB [Allorhizobium ampelinum]MCF1465124.1 chemotaxis protein CheB [Allorhizobium ampelinum]MCF1474970.1 chemotaxis protein CheB [Allorhizobium ampelinum]
MTDTSHGAVIIGASAGALEALSVILPSLPSGYPYPVFVVVHVPPHKRSVLAEIFNAKCQLRAVEVEDKEPIEPGVIYFAPPNYHMLIEDRATIALSSDEEVMFSRPSIDVAFESAAEAWGDGLLAVVLTGANSDGAKGLSAVAKAGGGVIVQQPLGAYARAMPEAAIAACPQARVLSLQNISSYLLGIA